MNVETNIEYAVMIRTHEAFTDTDIGLYSGSLCLITGRPGYSGANPPVNPPLNPVTTNPQNTWKEGLIAKDSLGIPEEVADPTLGGGYSTMSGMELRLINNPPEIDGFTLFDYLNAIGVSLFRCDLQFFAIIDGTFELWGTYSVEDVINEEHLLRLAAVDGFLTIHKDTLTTEVSPIGFPEAPEDSQGRFIPVCIGRIPQAELLPVTGQIVRRMLSRVGITEYELARIIEVAGANSNTITIGVGSNQVSAEALKDKYIRIARVGQAGAEYAPTTIGDNEASTTPTTGGFRTVKITLSSPFSVTPQAGWWVQIYELENFNAASDSPVHSFTPPLLGYQDGNFIDIEGKVVNRYPLDGENFPPVQSVAGLTARPEGDFAPYQPQDGFLVSVPDIIRRAPEGPGVSIGIMSDTTKSALLQPPYPFGWRYVQTAGGGWTPITSSELPVLATSDSYPALDASLTKLANRKRDEGYSRIIDAVNINSQFANASYTIIDCVNFEIPLPADLVLESGENLGIAFDADFVVTAKKLQSTIGLRVRCYAHLTDIYNVKTTGTLEWMLAQYDTGVARFSGNNEAEQKREIRQLGGIYYDAVGVGAKPTILKNGSVDLMPVLRNRESRKSIKSLMIQIVLEFSRFQPSGGVSGTKVLECGHRLYKIALFRTRDAYVGQKYSYVTGATFGTPQDIAPVWDGRRDPHKPVLSIPDAVEYLMRNRDKAGDKIDIPSFDAALYQRPSWAWYIGRQITAQKNTKDYIAELCKHGFLCIVPGRDGKRRLMPLNGYDNPGIVATYDESNILDGSVSDSAITGLDRVYTGLELRYDKNPATGDYRSVVYIRNTDQVVFPAYATGSNAEWTKYAGGFGDYETAKACWEMYREAYLASHRENIYKLDCDWFQKNSRVQRGVPEGLEPEDAAVSLAWILAEWYSGPRVPYTFRVPLTTENVNHLQLLNRVLFQDVKRTGGLYYKTLVERVALDTTSAQIEVTVSRRAKDQGSPDPEGAAPKYITEIIGGDTITEVVGADTITEIVNQ